MSPRLDIVINASNSNSESTADKAKSRSYESRRLRNNMLSKKCRYHKKTRLQNLQKRAEMLELQQKLLEEQSERLKCEGDNLIQLVKDHAQTCSGILDALLAYGETN